MKRVLSIMLTMMLVFSLFTGVITASAALQQTSVIYQGDISTLTPGTSTNDIRKYGSTAYFRKDDYPDVGVTPQYSVGEYLASSEEVSSYPSAVAEGITSSKVIKVTRNAKLGWLRIMGNKTYAASSADGSKLRATFRVYLTDIKSQSLIDNGDGTKTHSLTNDTSTTSLTMMVGPQGVKGTSTSVGSVGGTVNVDIPVNQWYTVTTVLTPTKSSGTDRYAYGIKFDFGTSGEFCFSDVFPATMFIDGNILLEKVEEVSEPEATLAPCFKSNMVIQRNAPIKVWGTSTKAGNTVTVTLGDNNVQTATTTATGWEVTFPAMSAQSNLTLTMDCSDDYEKVTTVSNIAIGEVILAAGQSNMAFDFDDVSGIEDIRADEATWSNVKMYRSTSPVGSFNEETSNKYAWVSFGSDSFNSGSGIGLLTAYNLAKKYNIPVGVIEAAAGGVLIETFMSMETLQSRTMYEQYITDYNTAKAGTPPTELRGWKNIPTVNYNAWLNPIKGLKIGSCLWYQGENNANVDIDKTSDIYYYKQLDLFNQFRNDFGNANMPIAVIQLAPFDGSGYDYTKIRQSQLDVSNTMNNVYLVPTADLGPVETDSETIHPSNKLPIAERCANVLKFHNFGDVVEYSGPTYKNMTVNGNEATLSFSHTDVYDIKTTFNVKNLTDTTAKAGFPRLGASGKTRWEFRPNGGADPTITRLTVATVSETYPDVATGLDSARTLAKVERINKTGFLRIVNTDVSTVAGDHIRMTVKVYPTDIMLNASTADTNNTVEKLTWQIKAQKGGDGSGVESEIQLIPNEWNTIEYEFDVKDAGVNGVWLNYGFVNDGNTADTSAFASTIFFDGEVKIETLPAASVATNSLKTSDGGDVKGFKVCGTDGVFYDATATISGNQITVSSESVANPVEVQYCYVPWDENDHTTLGGNVVNAAGIPLAPFKATHQDADIASANQVEGNTYKVTLESVGYNAVAGKIVAVLYDGAELADVKFVDFKADMHGETTKVVTFTPAGDVTNPSVKIMAWSDMNTLVPYCEAKPVQ